MSGWQEAEYNRRLARRRDDARWERDRQRLRDIMHGRYPQYVSRVPKGPLTRLASRGMIRITEVFMPTLGISRYRIDFVTWVPLHEIELGRDDPPRAISL